jgi:hypothetical protein
MLKTPGNYVEVGIFQAKFVSHFLPISVPRYQRTLMSLDVERLWESTGRTKGGAKRAC